ncbi:MAG TPA: A/G-specific adenine glycosylase [Candidatus Binatia bacterium]
MSAKNLPTIRRKLLSWYEKTQRDLPWRRTHDPYAIWIAETMLQQTQVKTALPYYERFLRRLPNIESLARAPLERVLQLWSGLGYYRRAENLRMAARQILRDHHGKLPEDYRQLRALAGIGDYTAGALLSIAFGKNYPAIDGNVRRVLSRFGLMNNEAALRALAIKLVAGGRPGDFNQALMELGATLCTSRAPNCVACPLKRECLSLDRNNVLTYPYPMRAESFTDVTWPLAIVRYGGKILLHRRAATALLGRLWELPGIETTRPDRAASALRRQLHDLPVKFAKPRQIGEIRHSITHRRIRAPIYLFDCAATIAAPAPRWRWVPWRRVEQYPVSSMTKKALAVLAAHETRFA